VAENPLAGAEEAGDVLRPHQIGGQLDHVLRRQADLGERRLKVVEHLLRLPATVVAANQVPIAVERDLAGDRDQAPWGDGQMRVGAARLRQSRGIRVTDSHIDLSTVWQRTMKIG